MRSNLMGTTTTNTGSAQRCNLTYVLITPARNEAMFIEQTIKSVVETDNPADEMGDRQ